MKLYLIQYVHGGVAEEPEVFITPKEAELRWVEYFSKDKMYFDKDGYNILSSPGPISLALGQDYLTDSTDGDNEVRRWTKEI